MSIFDIVELVVKCPYCGVVKEREFTVKDLGNNLKYYTQGDKVKTKYENIYVIGTSHCCKDENKIFDVLIEIRNKTITGNYRNLKLQFKEEVDE